jgi:translation initiation factor 2B subunit (eIF-2B alpha/beta/delta family)
VSVLAERLEELRRDDLHGASWVARRAVEALAAETDREAETSEELIARLTAAGRELAATRPAAGGVAGAVGRLLAAARASAHLQPSELARLVRAEAEGLISRRDRAKASIAIQLRERLVDALVVTHSASATVREALVYGTPAFVICTVTEPHGEGRRFAEDLRETGAEVELVEDADAVEALERSSLLLLGADTVFRDGGICNRVGSLRLAQAAHELNVPTVVAAETIKLAPVDAPDAPPLDMESARLFELVDAHLVDAVVTEDGTVSGPDVRVLVDRTPFLAQGWALLTDEPVSSQ